MILMRHLSDLSAPLFYQVSQGIGDHFSVYMLVAPTKQHHHRNSSSSAHSHHLFIPRYNCLLVYRHLAQRVLFQDVAACIVDDKLRFEKVEVLTDRVNQSQIIFVGGFGVNVKSPADRILALSVFEYLTVVAVNNVNVLIENQVALEAITLMSIQVNNHYFACLQLGL